MEAALLLCELVELLEQLDELEEDFLRDFSFFEELELVSAVEELTDEL